MQSELLFGPKSSRLLAAFFSVLPSIRALDSQVSSDNLYENLTQITYSNYSEHFA